MQNDLYQTPLHLATYLNQPVVVQALVEKKACLELQDQDGNTPLHVACAQGYLECANELTRENGGPQSNVLKMQNWRGRRRTHTVLRCVCRQPTAFFHTADSPRSHPRATASEDNAALGQITGKPAGTQPDYRSRWCASLDSFSSSLLLDGSGGSSFTEESIPDSDVLNFDNRFHR
ncbi:UNVERIFIED_CONTAM: hypothetical protein FKN15_046536 [Acipenser sinensis]